MSPIITRTAGIGIDPGVKGGIAFIDNFGKLDMIAFDEEKINEIWAWLKAKCEEGLGVKGVIEQVGGYIPRAGNGWRGGEGQPGSHMFRFGEAAGVMLGFLAVAKLEYGLEYRKVSAQRWQGFFKLKRPKGANQTQWKNVIKAKAKLLFPNVLITNATADAVLMAEYARRTMGV